jgi:hypothetical protein
MVREYSAGGPHSPPDAEAGDSTTQQPLDLRGGAVDLTQELAQLLAASIAQNQPGRRGPGATTGAELASLAALVSASQSQRAHAPAFKDGLSSLSYAPAASRPAPSSSLLVAEHHDDEPMPIPSTWRESTGSDDVRWYRQQLGAAALGLVAGLTVVVPAVLWLSGWLGGPQATLAAARQPVSDQGAVKTADARADVKTIKVQVLPVETAEKAAPKAENTSQYVTASIDPRPPLETPRPVAEQAPVPVPAPKAVAPPRPQVEELLAQVVRRIGDGDVVGAREFLLANESMAPGPMTFALAETYDPNMLAAWGTRGVAADPNKARSLYFRARDLGETRAQQRLDLLK